MIVRIVSGIAIGGMLVLLAPDVRAQPKTCAQIVGVNQLTGGKLSAEELAKKLNLDVETVRDCLDKKAQEPKGTQTAPPAPK